MSKATDLRVIKTQKLIIDSFMDLLDKKGFESITINDISERAQINRSTFYIHYTDKYELLNKIADETIDKLFALIAPESHIHGSDLEIGSFAQNIKTILKTIADDALFYKVMLGDNGIPDIRKKIIVILKQKLGQSVHEQSFVQKELYLELLLWLYTGAITWWLNNNMAYSPAYMAEQLIRFLTLGPVKAAGLTTAEVYKE